MIGRTNARRGARRIFAVLQNRRLNQHIAYTIIDEVSVFDILISLLTDDALSSSALHCALSGVKYEHGDVIYLVFVHRYEISY